MSRRLMCKAQDEGLNSECPRIAIRVLKIMDDYVISCDKHAEEAREEFPRDVLVNEVFFFDLLGITWYENGHNKWAKIVTDNGDTDIDFDTMKVVD
jgi:hypothetical protein